MQEILINVAKDGSTKIETRGFKGNSCRIATAEIERALGTVTSDKSTAEASTSEQSVQLTNRS